MDSLFLKDLLQSLIISLFYIMQVYYISLTYYYHIISLFGLFPYNEENDKDFPPENKFALVIAAHNEEEVIAPLIQNLKQLDYPRELYDVYVIADNCTDNTANISRLNGAIVYERFNNKERGKGYALKEFFEKYLFLQDKKYDAVCVFDADNLVSTNYLIKMNNHLIKGHKVIQCYLDTKNPDDTWITLSNALAYWIMNRTFQLARKRLGLYAAIGGTGFCIELNTLKEVGWDALSLTEDLEFTMKCVLRNIKVYWEHTAKIYDEKPLTLKASYRQRVRWLQGHWDCSYKYTIPLLKKAIKEKSLIALDAVIYMLQPSKIAIYTFLLIAFLLKLLVPNFWFSKLLLPIWIWGIGVFAGYLIPLFVLITENVGLHRILGGFAYIVYGFTWYPTVIEGWLKRKKKEWVHTKHTRKVNINEIQDTIQ